MIDKNRKKELAKKQRVCFDMNLGTITHKSKRYPSRQERKNTVRNLDLGVL